MFKPTFDATILYKSGNKHTVCGLLDLTLKNGTCSWETGGPQKPMVIGVDTIEAAFYTINPWYKNMAYAIWRKI
jgi:hypothetical protein